MVSDEFQKLLSFSWKFEVMVGSAASQGATRPSYFGPDSQKFSSSGLAACAVWPKASKPRAAPSAAPTPWRPGFLRDLKRSYMGNPPDHFRTRTVPRSPDKVKCNAATLAGN